MMSHKQTGQQEPEPITDSDRFHLYVCKRKHNRAIKHSIIYLYGTLKQANKEERKKRGNEERMV